ncbi:MAG: extracellular solute-binding protein [Spirochaetes bacterium]|nr:extracellular solute-binding protein [Spirochaetota bacterium]
MKKILIVLLSLCFLFTAAFLTFASGEKESKAEKPEKAAAAKEEVKMEEVTVEMWAGPESRAMLKVIDEWNAKYAEKLGIKVSLVTIGRVGYPEKVVSQLMSGVDKPDLIQAFSIQVGAVAPYLEPLEPFLASKNFASPEGAPYKKEEMIATALKSGEVEGIQRAIPTDISWHIMYYRKDLMDLVANPIETWDQWIPRAKEFTKSYNSKSPVPYGTSVTGKLVWHAPLHYLAVLWSYGGSMFKEGTMEPAFDSAAALKAAQLFYDLGQSGVLLPDFESGEFPEMVAAFQNEMIAFCPYWNAMYPMFMDCGQSAKICDKMAATVVPGARQADGSIKRAVYMHCITLGLNQSSKLKDKAFKFLAYATFGEGAQLYAKEGGAPPVYTVFTGPDAVEPYKSGAEMIAKYGRLAYPFPDLQAFLEITKDYYQDLLLGSRKPKDAMAALQKETTAFMKERGYID